MSDVTAGSRDEGRPGAENRTREPARRRGVRNAVAMAAAGVFVAAAAALFFALARGAPSERNAAATPGQPPPEPTRVRPGPSAPADVRTLLGTSTLSIDVRVEPAGSEVFWDGVPAGRTPVRVAPAPDGGVHELRVERPGYEAIVREIRTDEPQTIVGMLAVAHPAPLTVVPVAGTGSVAGRVFFDGEPPEALVVAVGRDIFCSRFEVRDESLLVAPDGAVQNVLVRVKDVPGTFAPPAQPHVVAGSNCQVRPRVSVALVGQRLVVRNDDPTTTAFWVGRDEWRTYMRIGLMPQGPAADVEIPAGATRSPRLLFVVFYARPWMRGYVQVSPHPFFSVTGEDGAFALHGLPAGRHVLEAWHEELGRMEREVVVVSGQTTSVDFVLPSRPAHGTRDP